MKTQEKKQQHTDEPSNLASLVIDRISNESIVPDSWLRLACVNWFVWMVWALSILFGALSVAVLIYAANHARFALFEATHTSAFSFFEDMLSMLWVSTFILMGIFSYINIRHTKYGYRYPVWRLLISSVVLSIMGGVVLHAFGVGYMADTQLAKNMPLYKSFEHMEQDMWQNPSEGRLVGIFTNMDTSNTLYMFTDEDQVVWSIETQELQDIDRQLLHTGEVVRVLGTVPDNRTGIFHACGVFPWMYKPGVSLADLREDRRVFVERMNEHMQNGTQQHMQMRIDGPYATNTLDREGVCAELVTLHRMKR